MIWAVLLSLTVASTRISGSPTQGIALSSESKYWNVLVLAQTWPPAFCAAMGEEGHHCDESEVTSSWVIHGLWPTKAGKEVPNFCKKNWKFHIGNVQSLRPRLDEAWPALLSDESKEKVWSKEWVKHGTCGTSVRPALEDQYHYFNTTLAFHNAFQLTQILLKGGIKPSENQQYDAEHILRILRNYIGASPKLLCVRGPTSHKLYLEQVEICLSRYHDFHPTDCRHESHVLARPAHSLLFQPVIRESGEAVTSSLPKHSDDCRSGPVFYKPMSGRSENGQFP